MNFEAWQEQGSRDAARRAHDLYRRALAEYEEPVLPADRREALDAFVARRSREDGAPIMQESTAFLSRTPVRNSLLGEGPAGSDPW